jgi:hypothetical protein
MQEKYRCIRKCYFRHRIYNVGDTQVFDKEAGEYIPRHFTVIGPPPLVQPPDTFKPIMKGLRAPIDPDQAEEVEAKRRAAGRPIDAHKAEGLEKEARKR